MKHVGRGLLLGLSLALFAAPAAHAQFTLTVNPERLDGEFDFVDKVANINNTMSFQVEGREFGASGEVTGSLGSDIVTIEYSTDFPNQAVSNTQGASVTQNVQVRVSLTLTPGLGSPTSAYFGQAAPRRCKLQAKIRDNESNDPDDPDKALARLSCDLGRDFTALDDDDDPGTPGDPPPDVLNVVEVAFEGRKDVVADVSKGKLQIKHNGVAP